MQSDCHASSFDFCCVEAPNDAKSVHAFCELLAFFAQHAWSPLLPAKIVPVESRAATVKIVPVILIMAQCNTESRRGRSMLLAVRAALEHFGQVALGKLDVLLEKPCELGKLFGMRFD
ncbi:MAG: hypothetical protein QOG48_782 [Verrucomicrobiota bacterium]